MSTRTKRQNLGHSIVVGYDGRPPADRAVEWAAREARAAGGRLTLLEVVPFAPVLPSPAPAGWAPLTAARAASPASHMVSSTTRSTTAGTLEHTAGHRVVQELRERFPDVDVQHHELRGDPVVELAEAGRDASLLVVGSRGDGVMRNIPSAQVGTRLARVATCPVAVVPHYRVGLVRRGVLAGVSVRAHAPQVLAHAYAHAETHDLPLTVVHASRDTLGAPHEDRARWLAEAVSGYASLHPGVRANIRVETGRPARILLRLAEPMDLLVVGQHGSSGGNPLGHVRSSIADRSPCPVVVVPPADPSH